MGWRPALALLPLGGVALGGGTARWSQGIVLLALGAILVVMPPRASLGRWLNVTLAALVALALTAFLPARWFASPAWRGALTLDFGLALPATLSPQPWLSVEGVALLLAGLSWFYLMASMRWTAVERVRAGAVFAAGVVALAGVFVTFYKLDVTVPFWLNARHFGPFPNRNQTADFLSVGALPVLATAFRSWRAGWRWTAAGWLAGWLVVAVAVFNNFSRAGVGILFGGTAVYLVAEAVRAARRRRPPLREVKPGDPLPDRLVAIARWRRIALAASLLLMLASGFFLFGGDTLGRFRFDSAAGAESVVTDDFRARIRHDAFTMVNASPWCGVGLGNFSPVMATYRRLSAGPVWLVHPESDWLWMAGEMGWGSVALVLAACVLLARRAWPFARGSDRALRTASALAVTLFALHGLVDVSAHRLGTVLCALFLVGLAMPGRGDDRENIPPSWERWMAGAFRGLGVAFVGVGALWLLESGGWLTAPGLESATRLKSQANLRGHVGDFARADADASRALAWTPLDWELRFDRAAVRVCLRDDPSRALDDFRRARYLEPFFGDHCLDEARLWAASDEPALAVNAVLEACRRQPARASFYLGGMRDVAAEGEAAFRERLWHALRHDPALELAFMQSIDWDALRPVMAEFMAANPDLQGLDDPGRRALFRLWAERGDPATLSAAMLAHPAWQPLGWRWWAQACAASDELEGACRVATRFAARPVVPPPPQGRARSLAELQSETALVPKDPVAGLALYRAQLAAGNPPGALGALHRLTIQPGCPAYFFYLEASLAGEAGQWQVGWAAWRQFIDKTAAHDD